MAEPSMSDALPMPGEEEAGEDDIRAMEADEVGEILGIESAAARRLLDILKPPMAMAIEFGGEEEL